jgi:hypothetical protein
LPLPSSILVSMMLVLDSLRFVPQINCYSVVDKVSRWDFFLFSCHVSFFFGFAVLCGYADWFLALLESVAC